MFVGIVEIGTQKLGRHRAEMSLSGMTDVKIFC